VLKVGGISADSRMPRRPLVPAPTKTIRPAAPQGGRHHLDADREPLAFALHRAQHLAVLGVHQVDEIDGEPACRDRGWRD
jgi:hypothetical protein